MVDLGLISTVSALVAAIAAVFSLRALIRQVKSSNTIAVWNAVAEHNRSIADNPQRVIALSIGFGLEQKNSKLALDLSFAEPEFDYWQMYWASRAIILSHMNLLTQVWMLADEKADRFEEEMTGWAELTRTVYLQLYDCNDPDTGKPALYAKPDWYVDACRGMQLGKADTAGGSTNWDRYTRRVVRLTSSELAGRAKTTSTKLSAWGRLKKAFGLNRYW